MGSTIRLVSFMPLEDFSRHINAFLSLSLVARSLCSVYSLGASSVLAIYVVFVLSGGTRRVVLLLPDGNFMMTEVDEEQYAALELDK